MADFTSRIYSRLAGANLSLLVSQSDNVVAGMVLGTASNTTRLAKCAPASEVITPIAIALVAGTVGLAGGASLNVPSQTTGIVTLPRWPIATPDGQHAFLSTLTRNTTYFLSAAFPGYLCAAAPVNDPAIPPGADVDKIPFLIGTALSATQLSLSFARLPINKWPTSLGGQDLETNASALAFPAALSEAVVAGAAVYIDGNDGTVVTVANAKADDASTASVAGLSITALASGQQTIVASGLLSLSSWLAATGSAHLTVGATYYLSDTTAGQLTTVAPALPVVVGEAITESTMLLGLASAGGGGGGGGGLVIATAQFLSFTAVAGNLYPLHGNQETAQTASLPLAAESGNGAVCGFKIATGAGGPLWKVEPQGSDTIDMGNYQFPSNTVGGYIQLTSNGTGTWYVTSLIELA